jgi:hypothetical protein
VVPGGELNHFVQATNSIGQQLQVSITVNTSETTKGTMQVKCREGEWKRVRVSQLTAIKQQIIAIRDGSLVTDDAVYDVLDSITCNGPFEDFGIAPERPMNCARATQNMPIPLRSECNPKLDNIVVLVHFSSMLPTSPPPQNVTSAVPLALAIKTEPGVVPVSEVVADQQVDQVPNIVAMAKTTESNAPIESKPKRINNGRLLAKLLNEALKRLQQRHANVFMSIQERQKQIEV